MTHTAGLLRSRTGCGAYRGPAAASRARLSVADAARLNGSASPGGAGRSPL
ncbi:hypothetical protein [Sphingomonas koreensis]|uniref:hypothetical protein n=1 Tax=Sphingomonas koreensis TaxID=93064 RepID=UPI00234F73DF|nr:hypothetical protein [Sphingomonas koreensis]MDC7810139.1 hypothetical protein [Sphingomonas koreensis]